MVSIREMRVLMAHRGVRVPVRVRLGRHVLAMVVIMVLVVLVSMLVLS